MTEWDVLDEAVINAKPDVVYKALIAEYSGKTDWWKSRVESKLREGRAVDYVLLGDGELNGGPTWESAMAAGHFKLANLTAIVDRNHLCIDGATEDIMSLEPLKGKWESFGWNVLDIDGHDYDQICEAIEAAQQETARPTVIIANTIKGKGVGFMENQPSWHYGGLDEAMQEQALAALEKE